MQRYKIDYFLWTGVVKDDAENKKLTNLLESQQINVVTASSGQRIKAGDVFIDILYPFNNLAGQEMKNTSNDAGVVNKIIYGKDSFLFTGDISSTVEKKLVNSGENIKSDVLKVAHHGSKYSTSDLFLKNVKPEYAVIEVGKNSYGHPTPEVLNRLKNFGIKVFNTYIDGDVEFISDGKTIQKL
jgi:competence protein ComEC